MKQVYIQEAKRTGIQWKTRDLGRNKEWNLLEPLDKALIYSNKILCALCSSIIVSLGLSTGLGFIHTGRQESFSFDIADLYKANTTIPASFDAVKEYEKTGEDLERLVRKFTRNYFNKIKILKRMPQDISALLAISTEDNSSVDSLLWDKNGMEYNSDNWNLAKLIEEEKNKS